MKGVVDDSGRAILPIKILCPKYPTGVQIDAWIDTGFTGDLVLPQMVIDDLQLEITGSIDGVLADGSGIELSTYHCELEWFGKLRGIGGDCELRPDAFTGRGTVAGKRTPRRLLES
jgi:predicted aspartyl protease